MTETPVYDRCASDTLPDLSVVQRIVERALDGRKVCSLEEMGGGFSTSNIRIDLFDGERMVLRLRRSRDKMEAETAVLNLIATRAPEIPVPVVIRCIQEPFPMGYAGFITTFAPGRPMHKVEAASDVASCASLYAELGELAARLHHLRLSGNGMVSKGLRLSPLFNCYKTWATEFFENCLRDSLSRNRLGETRVNRLSALFKWQMRSFPVDNTCQVCHGDFNTRNILLEKIGERKYTVSAILDWEFCSSGSGLLDLGNLFRFNSNPESPSVIAFSKAYTRAGGTLDSGWIERAQFIDLLSLCGFLQDRRERPATQQTVLARIDQTLEYFARHSSS
jgi:aminoglycoside phosphotransferase (APT) family kinase protein